MSIFKIRVQFMWTGNNRETKPAIKSNINNIENLLLFYFIFAQKI